MGGFYGIGYRPYDFREDALWKAKVLARESRGAFSSTGQGMILTFTSAE